MLYHPGNLSQHYTDLYFTTATIKDWKHLLRPDKYKKMITESLDYLVQEQLVQVYAFVIMPNHIHLVWQIIGDQSLSRIQLRLLKFIAQQIKQDLALHHPAVLDHFKVQRKDRKYQFFKEKPLSIPLYTDRVALQKINYIHQNPIQAKWNLADSPEFYHWSSAAYYESGKTDWPFLSHFFYGKDWPCIY
jgi:putative transposase